MSIAAQGRCSHKLRSEDTVTITDKDNGREVSIAKGGTLILRLEVRPGTGYSWQVAENDPDYLKLQGEPVFEKPDSKQAGETECQVFRFTAQTSGSSVWLIKNSWGTGWGKQGYMWIAYDSNQVGYGASWVMAKANAY